MQEATRSLLEPDGIEHKPLTSPDTRLDTLDILDGPPEEEQKSALIQAAKYIEEAVSEVVQVKEASVRVKGSVLGIAFQSELGGMNDQGQQTSSKRSPSRKRGRKR